MYKLKEGMNLPKEFKIKVNPEQSEALQLYLFSIGVSWLLGQKTVEFVECPYLFIGSKTENKITYEDKDKKGFDDHRLQSFDDHRLQRIKFKDYFEKVTNQFPEKWCIEVNEGNCNELNIWMHRNWKNYEGYKDTWKVKTHGYYFHCESVSEYKVPVYSLRKDGYTLITIEQFQKQFGIVNINETEIKAMESNIDFWHERANYHKQRCKDLRREKWEMSNHIKFKEGEINRIVPLAAKEIQSLRNEIDQLKKELEFCNSIK